MTSRCLSIVKSAGRERRHCSHNVVGRYNKMSQADTVAKKQLLRPLLGSFPFFESALICPEVMHGRAEDRDVSHARIDTSPNETDELPRLTRDEDDELRRLNWIAQIGSLSFHKRERMMELRMRDRRTEIREPREFAEEVVEVHGTTRRKWYHFGTR